MSDYDKIKEHLKNNGFSQKLINAFFTNLYDQGIMEEEDIVYYIDNNSTIEEITEEAFYWSDSNEGEDFWCDVSRGIRRCFDDEKYEDYDVCLDFNIIIK